MGRQKKKRTSKGGTAVEFSDISKKGNNTYAIAERITQHTTLKGLKL